MGSRGGGFLSLVVANGAIYNRIIIPGKTRLLTPCRGIWLGPLRLSRLRKGQNEQSWREAACPSAALSTASSACSRVWLIPSCLHQGSSPCLALLSSPVGSVCWLRMPELLPVPAAGTHREAGGKGRDARGWIALLVALPKPAQPAPSQCWLQHALMLPRQGAQALPYTIFPQLSLFWSLCFAKEVLVLGQRAKPALSRPHSHS